MHGLVNLPAQLCVYKMSATQMPSSGKIISAPAEEIEDRMERNHWIICENQKPATAQADRLRWSLAVYPLRQ